MKYITLGMILTPEEYKQAKKLKHGKLIAQEIIAPNIERINKAVGQQNDPLYLGYLIEHLINQNKPYQT